MSEHDDHVLRAILDSIDGVRDQVSVIQRKLDEHVQSEDDRYLRAFPDGDLDGHRRAHAAQIRKAEEQAEFWRKMRIKIGEMTVWAVLVCLAAVLAYYWNGHMPSSAQINIPGAK